eukprot:scaffold498569_cov23-Prasinocladus_malaysianus.AAC.3
MADQMRAAKMKIFVRRGGPNYQGGLAAMRALGGEVGLPVEVYGPEASMTSICGMAIQYVKSFDQTDSDPAASQHRHDCGPGWSFWGSSTTA